MAGVYQLEITESESELKKRLSQEKTASGKERLQLLYILKTKKLKLSKKPQKSSHSPSLVNQIPSRRTD